MAKTAYSAGGSALFLTGIGMVSQLLSFGYRVLLSRMVGAEGMGLYQLVMSAYSVLMSLSTVGLTACASNLSARYLALGNGKGMEQTRRLCLVLLGCAAAFLLAVTAGFSDPISVYLLGDARTQLGLVLLMPCVFLTGVENIHKHIFYGAGLVRPPAFTELAEQGIRAAAVLGLLFVFLPQNPERTIGLIVMGMVICEVFSSVSLVVLYRTQFSGVRKQGRGEGAGALLMHIRDIALPVGITSLLGNLMGAANSTLIPRKLVEGGVTRAHAMEELGIMCGMTLPMLSLPTVFLGALNLVMVPRLARSAALCQKERLQRQIRRALTAASVLILPAMAMMVVLGKDLAVLMFGRHEAGNYLFPLAVSVVFSCCQSVFGGVLNGTNEQGKSAVISLLCDVVQLAFVFTIPLPGVGMKGFVAGTLLSSALGAILCARCAVQVSGVKIPAFECMTAPALGAVLTGVTGNLLFRYLKDNGCEVPVSGAITLIYGVVIYIAALQAQGISLRDVFWFRERPEKK